MKNILILTILSALFLQVNSQHTNIMISNQNDPEEPSIMMDPLNPDHIVAGANLNNLYTSTDGGYTWTEEILTCAEYGVWGDPVIAVDTAGDFYFLHLSNPPAGNWIDRIVIQKSTDIGATWSEGTYMGLNGAKAQDKQWISIDRTNNAMYVTWTQFDDYGSANPADSSYIMFSKSVDSGETWSPAVAINEVNGDCIDDDFTTEGAVPAVGPNGEVYVAWAGPLGITFDRSLDGGDTWLENDIFVSTFPGGWTYDIPGIFRCNGLPVTVCDTSGGPNHGTIYVNWTDQRNGEDDTDVWLVKSTDGGDTWTAPARVNDDPAGKHQFFTWMAVDQANGNLYFVFYDRRNYDDDNTDVYMAMSEDGGDTFVNFKISESPFVPQSSVFFGDYTNLTVYNDIIRPIWTRLDGIDLSVWTAIVDINALSTPVMGITNLSLEQNYPNPFSDHTYFSFKLHKSMKISLKVFDLYGREIATIVENEILGYGKYKYGFNFTEYNLSNGIYYFSLISDEGTVMKKMIITK